MPSIQIMDVKQRVWYISASVCQRKQDQGTMNQTLASSTKSKELFERAEKCIPGGVNSPVRAFKAVGGTPPFIAAAEGAYVIDVDEKRYVDYVGSWGPMILGHSHPAVMEKVIGTAKKGLSFGASCELEVELAEEICQRIPSIEKIRMVNSGTEATMTAIRLARGYTQRSKIIKFEGCYHGHADMLLVKAGSGALTFGTPSSPGIPKEATQHTLTADYNDLDSVADLFKQYGNDIAAIIIEPIPGNMNMLLPIVGFLEGLRELCDQYGSLLIFDEVMTGFRVSSQGVQGLYHVTPDLTTLGKIIGGGLPVGAFGGRREIMSALSPEGPVYQAGTLSGNPVAMAAGLATLKELKKPEVYQRLAQSTQELIEGILQRAKTAGIPLTANYRCGMFGLFFTPLKNVTRYKEVVTCNQDHFKQFFHGMLNEGIYLAPSAYEAGFVSLAHGRDEIKKTLDAAEKVFQKIQS